MTTQPQQEQRYRAMSRAAVWSAVLGAASILTAVHWVVVLIPLAGIFLARSAKRRIRKAPEELTGMGLAQAGMGMSIVFGILGCGWLISAGVARVPDGYDEIDYTMLQPDPDVRGQAIPPEAFDLHDKRVFVEGFMLPGRSPSGLNRFVLCPPVPNCNFCTKDPKPTEMIRITLEGDLVTDYTIHPIHVGGTFEVDPNPIDGLPYRMKVDYLR
jgi:hypothetical protein